MKTAAAVGLALALAAPGAARAGAPAPAEAQPPAAGFAGAGLQPGGDGSWDLALATGVVGRFDGYRVDAGERNPGVLLFFGWSADAAWGEGRGRAARLRVQLFTGGEGPLFAPSEGEAEATYGIGPRELRFVVVRAEVARSPGLALQALVQLATLPSFEGTVPVGDGQLRVFYQLSPVELAWVRYYDRAHLGGVPGVRAESDRPGAASAARVRVTFELPPAVLASVGGDLLKLWDATDRRAGLEASLGGALLDRSVLVSALVRWEQYARRGPAPGEGRSADQLLLGAAATITF